MIVHRELSQPVYLGLGPGRVPRRNHREVLVFWVPTRPPRRQPKRTGLQHSWWGLSAPELATLHQAVLYQVGLGHGHLPNPCRHSWQVAGLGRAKRGVCSWGSMRTQAGQKVGGDRSRGKTLFRNHAMATLLPGSGKASPRRLVHSVRSLKKVLPSTIYPQQAPCTLGSKQRRDPSRLSQTNTRYRTTDGKERHQPGICKESDVPREEWGWDPTCGTEGHKGLCVLADDLLVFIRLWHFGEEMFDEIVGSHGGQVPFELVH